MIKKYVYGGKVYFSPRAVKQAIFAKERLAFEAEPIENKAEFWEKFGVTYMEIEESGLSEVSIQPEEQAANIRIKRDRLLAESDFYMTQDYPTTENDLAAVKEYRKKLRDITTQNEFPSNVVWPELPTVLLKQPKKALYSNV